MKIFGYNFPQQCLNFFPDPQGHCWFLEIFPKLSFALFEGEFSDVFSSPITTLANVVIGEENTSENSPSNKAKDNFGKISRNQQCPCGSGKKFKHCCGKL